MRHFFRGKERWRRLFCCLFCCLLCWVGLHWGPGWTPTPGPGVVTMRRTLKQDLPRLLLTQRKRESRKGKKREKRNEINGLCVAWKQWRPFSTEAPVPSVPALQHSQSQQAALCGRCWTRVTPSMCPAALDDTDRRPSPSSPFSPSLLPPPTQLFSRLGPGRFFTDAVTAHLSR